MSFLRIMHCEYKSAVVPTVIFVRSYDSLTFTRLVASQMMPSARGRPLPASLRVCSKHAQHREALLDGSKTLLGAEKRCSRQLRARRSKNTEPDMLRTSRAAQQAHSRSQRANVLSQKRNQITEASSLAAQDELTSDSCGPSSQHVQQHHLVQVIVCFQPAVYPCLSTLAVPGQRKNVKRGMMLFRYSSVGDNICSSPVMNYLTSKSAK